MVGLVGATGVPTVWTHFTVFPMQFDVGCIMSKVQGLGLRFDVGIAKNDLSAGLLNLTLACRLVSL